MISHTKDVQGKLTGGEIRVIIIFMAALNHGKFYCFAFVVYAKRMEHKKERTHTILIYDFLKCQSDLFEFSHFSSVSCIA